MIKVIQNPKKLRAGAQTFCRNGKSSAGSLKTLPDWLKSGVGKGFLVTD